MSQWQEQYQRMKRARGRLNREWNDGTEGEDKTDRVRDAFFVFFQNCYHMVDWLENDPARPIRRAETDRFVKASPALSLCDALCQGSKHAVLKQKGITAVQPERQVISELPFVDSSGKKLGGIQFSAMEMTVVWSAGQTNAFDLADECFAEWDQFLVSRGLVLPT